jgi:hypothetical protein
MDRRGPGGGCRSQVECFALWQWVCACLNGESWKGYELDERPGVSLAPLMRVFRGAGAPVCSYSLPVPLLAVAVRRVSAGCFLSPGQMTIGERTDERIVPRWGA